MGRVKGDQYSGSKRAARAEAADDREVNRVHGRLCKIQAMAQHIRDEAHLDEILSQDDSLTPELRQAMKTLILPMIPKRPAGEPVAPPGFTVSDPGFRVH